jgi:Fic family protein
MSKIVDYVVEEVERQGHDTSTLDGIERVGWMLNAWAYALGSPHIVPFLEDAVTLGRLVEPVKNKGGLRQCGVRVGDRICPDFGTVPWLLQELFVKLSKRSRSPKPLEFYKEFELIHPFVDGNGRTGKILMNWTAGMLLEPTFPPNDLFGFPIRNP